MRDKFEAEFRDVCWNIGKQASSDWKMKMAVNAIGIVELSSIAQGFQVQDTMLKAADVKLLVARTICSGKYMVMVGGAVDEVRSSVDAGEAVCPMELSIRL